MPTVEPHPNDTKGLDYDLSEVRLMVVVSVVAMEKTETTIVACFGPYNFVAVVKTVVNTD